MKTIKPTARSPFLIVISTILGLMLYGCSSKTYVSTYTAKAFNPRSVAKMAVVLEDVRVTEKHNLVFAETFVRTALEKKKFMLVENTYILKETLPKLTSTLDADAYIEIALTHCYPGNQSRNFPTSVGAHAKIVDPKSHNLLWSINYAYASSKSGASAPMIEEAMHIVAGKIIEFIPLEEPTPNIAAYTLPQNMHGKEGKLTSSKAEAMKELEISNHEPPLNENGKSSNVDADPTMNSETTVSGDGDLMPDPSYTSYHTGAYVIHIASVRKKPIALKFADKQSSDSTLRLCSKMNADPEKLWYRLLIGRFSTLEDSQSYIQTLKATGEINGYARTLKLPYSLLISAGHPLEPSQKIVEALRQIDYMAYLSPSQKAPNTYDVFVGAFSSRDGAGQRARTLVKNGIPVSVITY